MQYTRKLPSIKDQNHTDCVTVTLLTITITHNLDFQSLWATVMTHTHAKQHQGQSLNARPCLALMINTGIWHVEGTVNQSELYHRRRNEVYHRRRPAIKCHELLLMMVMSRMLDKSRLTIVTEWNSVRQLPRSCILQAVNFQWCHRKKVNQDWRHFKPPAKNHCATENEAINRINRSQVHSVALLWAMICTGRPRAMKSAFRCVS